MIEPTNTSMGVTRFSGKSHNKHPYWRNQPLRLNEQQEEDPTLIFQEFFECYDLQEVRETLWEWLVEVLSSGNSISQEGSERNNHIFFYEKLEAMVEACFTVQKGGGAKTNADIEISQHQL